MSDAPLYERDPAAWQEQVAVVNIGHTLTSFQIFSAGKCLFYRPIFTAATGLHSHFPLWAPDAEFLYFVQGELPDKMDVWRIRPAGPSERAVMGHPRLPYAT